MKILMVCLLCLTIGYQIGRHDGFDIGAEWALQEAEIQAREAGLMMPVKIVNGTMKVIVPMRRGTWRAAEASAFSNLWVNETKNQFIIANISGQ